MTNEFSFSKTVQLPNEYYSIDKPKQDIAKAIKKEMENKKLSIRKVANNIENFHHPQLLRITQRENYNINTLLKVLDELDLELKIVQKGK